MDENTFNQYLKNRYENQINWYSKSATKNKCIYTVFQWSVVILSSSLPVLIVYLPEKYVLVTISFSILLAILTASLKVFKYQENWINYRTIAETLKKERYYLDAEISDYSEINDKFSLFVDRVESIISSENSLWVSSHKLMGNKDDDGV